MFIHVFFIYIYIVGLTIQTVIKFLTTVAIVTVVILVIVDIKTLGESQNAAQRTSHRLSRFQNLLLKDPFKVCSLLELRFVIFKVLSQLECMSFFQNLSSQVLSQFEFYHILSFFLLLTIWVLSYFECCHIVNFVIWVLSQFEFCQNLRLVTIGVLSQLEFLIFLTIIVFKFGQNLSWSFVNIWFYLVLLPF